MAQEKNTLIPPAQLFVGPHEITTAHTQEYLQEIFCPNNNCKTCRACHAIRQHQHHAVLWLSPEKQYTRESIADIFQTITLALDPEQNFFFVLEYAERLHHAAANSLLKSVEEPPPGYHFIFLTERPHQLLSTITSRCTITVLKETSAITTHIELLEAFTTNPIASPLAFVQIVDKSSITEHESAQLIDTIYMFWSNQVKKAIADNNSTLYEQATKKINVIKHAIEYPPMPGSSKLYWKNLFMQLQ